MSGEHSALRVEGLSKTFPGQRALDSVSLEIRAGELHALVGQNGSGKSTLIKILSDFHKPDPGSRAWLGGREVVLGELAHEELASMKFIHQDLALIPTLSVRENLWLERRGRGKLAPVERQRERSETRKLLQLFRLNVDPEAIVGRLTPFEQSAVAIVRALAAVEDEQVHLLVLDEPTASLGAAEAADLFTTLARIKQMGVAILYVSHLLPEVLSIADRISVLRDGRLVAVREAAGMSEEALVELIVGRSVELPTPPEHPPEEERPLLVIENLVGPGVAGVDLRVRRGEVVGITGLVGSGYEMIPQYVSGARAWETGAVEINGRRFNRLDPTTAACAGLSGIPADRRRLGLIPHFTIAENVTLPDIGRSWRHGFINRRVETQDVRRWLDATGVTPPDPSVLVQQLSGGNQQKVLLAKALRLEPDVLVLAEPTQAVDVGAAASIRRLVTQLAERGRAVLVASSDPEELSQICHRVLVMRDGRVACALVGDEISEDRIVFESQFEEAAAA